MSNFQCITVTLLTIVLPGYGDKGERLVAGVVALSTDKTKVLVIQSTRRGAGSFPRAAGRPTRERLKKQLVVKPGKRPVSSVLSPGTLARSLTIDRPKSSLHRHRERYSSSSSAASRRKSQSGPRRKKSKTMDGICLGETGPQRSTRAQGSFGKELYCQVIVWMHRTSGRLWKCKCDASPPVRQTHIE